MEKTFITDSPYGGVQLGQNKAWLCSDPLHVWLLEGSDWRYEGGGSTIWSEYKLISRELRPVRVHDLLIGNLIQSTPISLHFTGNTSTTHYFLYFRGNYTRQLVFSAN